MKRRHLPIALLLVATGCPDELPPAPSDISIEPAEAPDNKITTVTIRGDFVVARLDVDFAASKQQTDQMIEVFLDEIELPNVKFLEKGAVTADVPVGMEIGMYDLRLRDPNGGEASLEDAFKVRLGTCADWNFLTPGQCGANCSSAPGCACLDTGICATVCGDGIRRDDEMCDDGNTLADDGCNLGCDIEPGWECLGTLCSERCGDGLKVGDETCDDGNTTPGDGCDENCQSEYECGDGLVEGFEECDVGPDGHPGCIRCEIQPGWDCSGTRPSMCGPVCGDGKLLGGEQCDDEDREPFDGCSDVCEIEEGWCCRGEPSRCHDTCGDGFIDAGFELCDDGNRDENDGCGYCCGVEQGWHCLRQPSICVEKATTSFVDDDGPSCELGDPGLGTFDDPYCQISTAIAGAHETIMVFEGTYQAVAITGRTRRIIAEEGVQVVSKDAPAVYVGDGAVVDITGLAVTAIGPGFSIEGANTLLDIRQCEAGPMAGPGVRLTQGAHLGMDSCFIKGCQGGGMYLMSTGGYRVTNTFIVENGEGGEVGGVAISETSRESAFVNNTVANNLSGPGDPSAVACYSQAEPIPLVNSILWDERATAALPVSAACAPRFSTVSGSTVALGNGNLIDPPQLSSDYHLEPTSPCIDAGDPAGVRPNGPAPVADHDGDHRPIGLGVDIGADEAF